MKSSVALKLKDRMYGIKLQSESWVNCKSTTCQPRRICSQWWIQCIYLQSQMAVMLMVMIMMMVMVMVTGRCIWPESLFAFLSSCRRLNGTSFIFPWTLRWWWWWWWRSGHKKCWGARLIPVWADRDGTGLLQAAQPTLPHNLQHWKATLQSCTTTFSFCSMYNATNCTWMMHCNAQTAHERCRLFITNLQFAVNLNLFQYFAMEYNRTLLCLLLLSQLFVSWARTE